MRKEPQNKLVITQGMRFGELTIIKELEPDKLWRRRFLCKCDCGNECIVFLYRLTQGLIHCSNKIHLRKKNAQKYIGQKYGKLIALSYIDYDEKNKTPLIKCKCDCGNETIVQARYLVKGEVKSCGCIKHHVFDKRNYKHGDCKKNERNRLFNIWMCMKNRCINSNIKSYKNYGGRGITVCSEWKDNYLAFKEWALNNGYNDNLTIDRIDVNGNYEPNNCRWVTKEQQANNKRNTIKITYNGETHTAVEWSKILGISDKLIRERYAKGYPVNLILYKGNVKALNCVR